MLLALLSACTVLPEKIKVIEDLSPQYLLHEQVLQPINHWQLKGRFAVSSDDDAWSGSLRWEQSMAQYSIHILGPLFHSGVVLSGDDRHSSLALSAKIYHDKNAETLLYRYTGLRFPFENLQYWMFGLASPNLSISAREFDTAGRLALLEQDGWRVYFKKYRETQEVILPAKIFIERFDLSIRLVFDQWNIQSGE